MSAPSEAGARQPDNPARPKANHQAGMELPAYEGNGMREAGVKETISHKYERTIT